MQYIARDGLTEAQVTSLIRDSPSLQVNPGLELLDRSLNVLADVSTDFIGGSVTRQSYADIHGDAELLLTRELDWGNAIVRPYVNLANGSTLTARFNLGAYFTSTPEYDLSETPPTFDVLCYDIMQRLDDPVGEAYSVAAGTAYLAAIELIFNAQGFAGGTYVIDQTSASSVLPASQSWTLDENVTWLNIVNQLAGAVGYQGVWSDWDGRLRLHPYVSPSNRDSEWTYDVSQATSMLSVKRKIQRDWYDVPNRWVFFRQNNVDGTPPIEGDGLYTVTNQSTGPTSIEARGGRVITKTRGIDAVDQAALVRSAQVTVDADMRLQTKVSLDVAPNPLHWHFDRVTCTDPALGNQPEALVTAWTLPLDGADMSQEWSLL